MRHELNQPCLKLTAATSPTTVGRPSILFLVYICLSISLIVLQYFLPFVSQSDGLPATSLSSRWSRGRTHALDADPCQHEQDKAWAILTSTGPQPHALPNCHAAALSCTGLPNNLSHGVRHVRQPFLLLPPGGQPGSWHAFYPIDGGIGVAESQDDGASWRHLGTALSEPTCPLAAPWVAWDQASEQYVMLPDASASCRPPGLVHAYATSAAEFPFGWQRKPAMPLPEPPTSRQGPLFARPRLPVGTIVAAQHSGLWWLFVTEASYVPWRWPWFSTRPRERYQLRVYHSPALLSGAWTEHASSPVCTDSRFARNGGRPFELDGRLHRWAWEGVHDEGDGAGGPARLYLLRIDTLSTEDYWETYLPLVASSTDEEGMEDAQESAAAASAAGGGNVSARAWPAALARHVDLQPVGPNGTWFGLVDADSGRHWEAGDMERRTHHRAHRWWSSRHFGGHPHPHRMLLHLTVAQLVIVLCAHAAGRLCSGRAATFGASGGAVLGGDLQRPLQGLLPSLSASTATAPGWLPTSWVPARSLISAWCSACIPAEAPTLLALALCSVLLPVMLFIAAPRALLCSRWNVHIDVAAAPTASHVDAAAPFDVSGLLVVTGATSGFFDRLSNMVGSVQQWEPRQRVAVYDLGFSETQLAAMMCWQNVEVRPFPYASYPPHVRDATNYAFKALALLEAIKGAPVVLWIDSGLELRAPMHIIRHVLAHQGHVSALQEDLIGNPMYTVSRGMADWFGLGGDRWEGEVRQWQFCAGGLQGFVRGSDAEQLVLARVAACSVDANGCMAPPGSSRDNHNFDQTAFTLAIRAAGLSCLPRETHMMWSVKKAAWDASLPSSPIEVVSRGHRLPKAYRATKRAGCEPDASRLPWPPLSKGPGGESTSRKSWWFLLTRVYLQPVGDLAVLAMACDRVHGWVLGTYGLLLALTWALSRRGVWGLRAWQQLGAWHAPGGSGRFCSHVAVGTAVLAVVQFWLFYLASNVR